MISLVMSLSAIILTVVLMGLLFIAKWDKPIIPEGSNWIWIFFATFLESGAIAILFREESTLEQMLLGIFAGCLLLACITDLTFCQVYNFTWWLGYGTGIGIILCRLESVNKTPEMCIIISNLICFCGLQMLIFRRMYGKADGYAFMACALVEAAFGMKLVGYLWQMLWAFLISGIVQGLMRNIAKNGDLKRPVPFLPYIVFSFWGIMLYHNVLPV